MQSPYQTFDGVPTGAGHDMGGLSGPERTSVLAVLALVFGLVCFIPGLGAIGAVCGIAALFLISQSRGRLGGMGLAIAGILLGLLFTALQIGLILGALQIQKTFKNQVLAPMAALFGSIEQQDYAAARKHFVEPESSMITDADFEKFRTAYHEKVGAFKEPPNNMLEFFSAYASFGPAMQKFQGRQDAAPFPAIFEKGAALVVYQMAPGSRPVGKATVSVGGPPAPIVIGDMPLKNIQILNAAGESITLFDPGATVGDKGADTPAPASEQPPAGATKPPEPPAPPKDGGF